MANDSTTEMAAAAQAGNIDLLYTIIKKDRFVLEHIDEMPFIDTPLHIAASAGDLTHLHFAVEIMRLKPSFAWKLNEEGFSPIHVALQKGHKKMVLRLVDINIDLIRIKGREGITPLHFVSQNEDIDLLIKFLKNCPDSIEDVTIRGETALHIAVKYGQYQALQVLVGCLQRNSNEDCGQTSILNWTDEAGNTVMRMSALKNDIQARDLLINTGKMDLDIKNLEKLTALDKAGNADTEEKLSRAEAKRGSSIQDDLNLVNTRRSKNTFEEIFDEIRGPFLRHFTANISEEQRNAYLIIATLMVTAIYQSALSPPGGVFQADNGANNLNNTSSAQGNIGKSVMSFFDFGVLLTLNAFPFMVSTWMILILTPAGLVGLELFLAAMLFAPGYFYSLWVISPNHRARRAIMYYMVVFLLVPGWMIMRLLRIAIPIVLAQWGRALPKLFKRRTNQQL